VPETDLVEDTLVWSSEKFILSNLSSVLVAKFCFREQSGRAKGFCAGFVCVADECWQGIDVLVRDRGVIL